MVMDFGHSLSFMGHITEATGMRQGRRMVRMVPRSSGVFFLVYRQFRLRGPGKGTK